MNSQIEMVTEAVHSGIGGFEPQNADDLGEFLKGLPDLYDALATSLNRVADRFGGELPVHEHVVEHLRELASGAAGQQEYAGEAHHLFRTSHEADLERIENPRPGEEFLDVSRQ